MKTIVVSGTPGTGKTEFSKMLAKALNFKYVDVNGLIKKEKLCEDYDKARHCNVVDVEKLNKALIKLIKASKQDLVIDSHMAHFLPKEYINLVVITRCGLKELKQRLERRDYPDAKVRENLDSEIFDICLAESQEQGHKTIEINTEKDIKKEIEKIKKMI